MDNLPSSHVSVPCGYLTNRSHHDPRSWEALNLVRKDTKTASVHTCAFMHTHISEYMNDCDGSRGNEGQLLGWGCALCQWVGQRYALCPVEQLGMCSLSVGMSGICPVSVDWSGTCPVSGQGRVLCQ